MVICKNQKKKQKKNKKVVSEFFRIVETIENISPFVIYRAFFE